MNLSHRIDIKKKEKYWGATTNEIGQKQSKLSLTISSRFLSTTNAKVLRYYLICTLYLFRVAVPKNIALVFVWYIKLAGVHPRSPHG